MDTLISVRDLRKVYTVGSEKVVALNNINLEIGRGQICCVLGTSGSGKSTLLNQLAGLEKPSRGSVYIGSHNISKFSENQLARFRQKYIGFIFQSYNLMNASTALENVAMPLMFRGMGKRERNKRALAMLKAVGLTGRQRHRPNQMSGGQQQRVGIARAFVARPQIVFADEPTGNLDTRTTLEVMGMMVRMARENNQTLILVTHDQNLAQYADRIVTLIDGEIVSDVENISLVDRMTPEEALEQYQEREKAMAEVDERLAVPAGAITGPVETPEEEPNTSPTPSGEEEASQDSGIPSPSQAEETPEAEPNSEPSRFAEQAETEESSTDSADPPAPTVMETSTEPVEKTSEIEQEIGMAAEAPPSRVDGEQEPEQTDKQNG